MASSTSGMLAWLNHPLGRRVAETTRMLALPVAVTLIAMLGLGEPALWDRDEPRNVGAVREMLDAGDWVVPTFNGDLRTAKPVLLYWHIMVAGLFTDDAELAGRLPSALAGIGTVILVVLAARRMFSPAVGVWTGLVLGTAMMVQVAAHAATPDGLLLFWSTAAVTAYIYGVFPRPREQDLATGPSDRLVPARRRHDMPATWIGRLVMFGCLGLAALAKGPVGVVMPLAVIGMFLLLVRKHPADVPDSSPTSEIRPPFDRQRMHWGLAATLIGLAIGEAIVGLKLALVATAGGLVLAWCCGARAYLTWLRPFHPVHFVKTVAVMRLPEAIAIVLVIAAPWYIWVGLRTDGEFLRAFFLNENLARASRPMEGHDGGMLFYPLAIVAGLVPWSLLLVPLTLELIRAVRSHKDALRGSEAVPVEEFPSAKPVRPAVRRVRPSLPTDGLILAGCWLAVWLGVFSLAQTKLPSYITPGYPGAAMLLGWFLHRLTGGVALCGRRSLVATAVCLTGVGLGLGIAFAITSRLISPDLFVMTVLGAIVATLGGLATAAVLTGRERLLPPALAGAAISLTVGLFVFGASLMGTKHAGPEVAAYLRGAGPVATVGMLEPSWVFYAGRTIDELPDSDSETVAAYLARQPEARVVVPERLETSLPPAWRKSAHRVARLQSPLLKEPVLILAGGDRPTAR